MARTVSTSGANRSGEPMRRSPSEVQDDGGLGPPGEPAEPIDDPAGLDRRGDGLRQDQTTGRDDDKGGGEVVEDLALPGLPAAALRRSKAVAEMSEDRFGQPEGGQLGPELQALGDPVGEPRRRRDEGQALPLRLAAEAGGPGGQGADHGGEQGRAAGDEVGVAGEVSRSTPGRGGGRRSWGEAGCTR